MRGSSSFQQYVERQDPKVYHRYPCPEVTKEGRQRLRRIAKQLMRKEEIRLTVTEKAKERLNRCAKRIRVLR